MPEAPARFQAALTAAGAVLAPFLVRGALIAGQTAGLERADLAGFCSDLGSAAAFAALLLGAARLWRWLPVALATVWALVYYGQYETALVLESIPTFADLRFLGSYTFVGGSVLWVSNPLILLGCLAGSAILVWAGTRRPTGARQPLGLVLAAAVLFAAHPLLPGSEVRIGWRHASLAQHNASRAVALALWPDDTPGALLELVPSLAADLSGRPRGTLDRTHRNVLLIFLESVSGAYLPSLRASHDISGGLSMPRLDRIAQGGLRYTNFVAHQRRTSRGLYAALCGDLPNLLRGTPKMTAYAHAGGRPCLPQRLREAGYRTAFVQAAPLAFMLKDQFMPKAGFQDVHGHDWFEPGYANSVWGVDDRSFFEQSLRMVDALRAQDEPWFLTLLTVGTHHPTIIPFDFQSERQFRFARAVAWLDLAIEEFVQALDERGIFDDTLVVLTSDESRGLSALGLGEHGDEVTTALTHNWGYLVVRTPEGFAGEVREPFGLVDLPVSILDYLGLGDRVSGLYGRSVFREYDEERHVFFANHNLHLVGAFAPGRRLYLCGDRFRDCQAFETREGRLFDAGRTELAWDASGEIVAEVARRSVEVGPGALQPAAYPLLTEPRFEVKSVFKELVHGGQHIDLRAGQWLEVEIEVDGSGGNQRASQITHRLTRDGGRIQNFHLEVRPGYRRTLEYTYAPLRDVTGVRLRTLAQLEPGAEPMRLNFGRARMTVHSIGPRPAPGVHVRLNDHRRVDAP